LLPHVDGRSTDGAVGVKGIFIDDDRPLLLWNCALESGAALRFERPSVGHVLYVAAGLARVGDQVIEPGGVAVVERGAALSLEAAGQRTVVLDFHRREPSNDDRAGGHVHVIPPLTPERENPATGMRYSLFTDSTCPTCTLWMHHVEFPAGAYGPPHLHTEDEIIVVVGGELHVGNRKLPAGSALAIDEDTVYSFRTGEEGVAFVNFRSSDPGVILVTRDGRQPVRLERDIFYSYPTSTKAAWDIEAPVGLG
jgi:redox-sensitive bicupin YhaK (pirin superfamily)